MKPSQALAVYRERIRAIVAHYGGVNPRVFGSVARGEDTEDSDLDILVDDPESHRLDLFALGGMNYDISSLIGRRVDVVPSADLPQRMRGGVFRGGAAARSRKFRDSDCLEHIASRIARIERAALHVRAMTAYW